MHTRHTRTAVTTGTILTVALALSGCFGLPDFGQGSGNRNGYQSDSIEVQVLYAAGDTGGVATQRISVSPSEDGDISIDISEDEVAGVGDMTRAASWNAVSVATLLTGAPLNVAYRFAFDGRVDGPSAGALTTIGLLAMYNGDDIDQAVTMTGTINPAGTVGTVGGIPEKMAGVIEAGELERVLIPAGQRNSPNSAGELVDVVALGADAGVEVVEVADVYDAYLELTGEELAKPAPTSPKVGGEAYDKYRSATDAALARYDRAAAQFAGLDPTVQEGAAPLLAEAQGFADRARDLQVQGLQGGAFFEASSAALYMQAIAGAFDTVQALVLGGADVLGSRLDAAATAENEFGAYIDQLGTYQPESLADAEALVTAYGNSFDSFALLQYATGSLQTAFDTAAAGGYSTIDELLAASLLPLIYYDFARGQLEFAKAVFEVGRDNQGAAIENDGRLGAIASFFRRAADADWAAFETGVIQNAAEARGESNDVYRTLLGSVDLEVALAYTAQQSLPAIQEYIGDGPNSDYAAMGYGYVNYARNAVLIEKYYNNGVLDENLALTGVISDSVLTRALDLGRDQLSAGIGVLSAESAEPVLLTGAYEQAGIAREGDVQEKFQAISQYSGGFVMARMLAYVGGFPREGYTD